MSNSYTLDDIRAAAEKKYGSTEITVGESTVELVNPLRMSRERRAMLSKLQDRIDAIEESGEDQETILRDAIRLIAKTEGQAVTLLDALGDDLAMLAQVFATYSESQEAGEA